MNSRTIKNSESINTTESPSNPRHTKSIKSPENNTSQHPLQEIIAGYLAALKNLGQTVQIVMPHVSQWLLDEFKKQEKKLASYIPEINNGNEIKEVRLKSAHEYADFTTIVKTLDELNSNRSIEVLARSLFVQLFCEFDAFTGALLNKIYTLNGGLLKSISREISLSDLIEYDSIDSAKKALLEKEIETFRRDSYTEQFIQLEKKFGLTLRKFPEWGEFIELGQRRNICIHNDGIVSEQYLTICDREEWKFPTRPAIGNRLEVSGEYLARALALMSKVGYMLGHTLWSKVFPNETLSIQRSLNDNLYATLEGKRWKIAAELGSFALTDPMRKAASEIDLRIRVINTAIALKFSNKADDACKLMKTLDWSASYRDFKLARAVLEDRFEEAIEIMEEIGRSGELIEQESYHIWPLFHKFRERPEFYETYEKIYGTPYLTRVKKDGENESISISTENKTKEKEEKNPAKSIETKKNEPPIPTEIKKSKKSPSRRDKNLND